MYTVFFAPLECRNCFHAYWLKVVQRDASGAALTRARNAGHCNRVSDAPFTASEMPAIVSHAGVCVLIQAVPGRARATRCGRYSGVLHFPASRVGTALPTLSPVKPRLHLHVTLALVDDVHNASSPRSKCLQVFPLILAEGC